VAPVRWGFLGAGWIATRALAPAVHAADGALLQAVAAREPQRAQALQPARRVHASYDDLLADDEVDAVYISLTNEVHAAWSIEAMRAGKHVLCEKPLAMSAAEVREMAEVARATGRLLVEASWYRWHPRVQAAVHCVRDGAVGAVRHVAAGFTFEGSLDGNYRLDPARGGGALYDVGCYAVSACLWAFGDAPPVDVVARQDVGPTGVDLTTEIVLGFGDGVGEAEARGSIAEPARQWIVIRGDAGEIELPAPSFTAWRDDATTLLVSDGRTTERRTFEPVDAYRLMVEAMSTVVAGGEAWLLPLAESVTTAAVIDAAFESARRGSAAVDVGP
jgi:predicted dehydrogenase